jgi:uncharacterized protein (TIGR04255 family)
VEDVLRHAPATPGLEPLPEFDNPPVVETVLSIQFEPLPLVRTAHLGLLWNQYGDIFPTTEERPPLNQVSEQFPETPVVRAGLRLQALDHQPVPRLWFTNAAGNEMIQVQNDRFIKNWRKEGEGALYPRYEKTIRPNFERDYRLFLAFLENSHLGTPHVNQCEVTYVNHIVAGEGWEHFGELEKVFTFWRSPTVAPPGAVDDAMLHVRFVIPDGDGEPCGRLHLDLQPAVRISDNRPMYVLNLTARGQIGDGIEFFDVGRKWIVHTFKRITTDSMHKIWRIRNDGSSGNH